MREEDGREERREGKGGRKAGGEKKISMEDDIILCIAILKNPPKTITANKKAWQLKIPPTVQTSLAYLRQ